MNTITQTLYNDTIIVIHLPEKSTIASRFEIQAHLKMCKNLDVILDCAGIEYADSSFLGLIAKYKDKVVMCSAKPTLISLLQLTRLDEVITLYGNLKDALEHYTK